MGGRRNNLPPITFMLEDFYMVDPVSFTCKRVTIQSADVPQFASVVRNNVPTSPLRLPRLGMWHGCLRPDGSQVWGFRLRQIRINTAFWSDGVTVSPTFDGGFTTGMDWAPPDEYPHYLACYRGVSGRLQPYIWCTGPADMPGTFLPSLPNVYNDMRLCAGSSSPQTCETTDLIAALADVYQVFRQSAWNTDLNPYNFNPRLAMKFDERGIQLPMDDDAKNHYRTTLRRGSSPVVDDWMNTCAPWVE